MTKKQQRKPQIPPQKPVQKKNTKGNILLTWCDGGLTDGKFTEGLVYTLLTAQEIPIKSAMRVQGNQIGRQRQVAFDYWLDNTEYEWTLWVDSDIELTKEVLVKLWDIADPFDKPVVSGVYFISKENEQSKMTPFPAIFKFTDDPHKIEYVHPLPKDAIVQVGCAGFGLLLIHRSVGEAMRSHHAPRRVFFNETGAGEQFVSEDIHFFRALYETRIPVFAHTGAVVKHMKRFSYDVEYYKLFWNNWNKEQDDAAKE